LGRGLESLLLARDHDLPRSVVVREPDRSAEDRLHLLGVEAEERDHAARSLLAALLHVAAARDDEVESVLDGERAREGERRVFAEREAERHLDRGERAAELG